MSILHKQVSERDIQVAFVAWALWQGNINNELLLLHSNPMGGYRPNKVGGQLKEEGARAGIPDLFLPVARKGKHGLYIEFKKPFKQPRADQRFWIEQLREQGYGVQVSWSFNGAVRIASWYLDIEEPPHVYAYFESIEHGYNVSPQDQKIVDLMQEQWELNKW